jgi:hypothetical protein
MYAGRFCQSSGSAGSLTLGYFYQPYPRAEVTQKNTFMIYDLGAMTLATNVVRDRPYRAAPRRVAVSASAGLAMTRMREENCSFRNVRKRKYLTDLSTHFHAMLQVFTSCKAPDQQQRIDSLTDFPDLILNQM